MDTTENMETEKVAEPKQSKPSRFTFLVFLACFLSAGSLAYSTYSFLDLNKISALPIKELGGLSLIGLSAAATMDVIWGATMVAEYRERKVWFKWRDNERVNILPLIGWIEVLAVAVMLGYHGNQIGGWTAAFTAVLPVATKFTWILAMDDIRDPSALTEEQREKIAAKHRSSLEAKAMSDATAELHLAKLEAQKRANEASLEDTRAAIEKKKLEQQAAFELEEAELRGANRMELLKLELRSSLQIEKIDGQQKVELKRLDAEESFRLQQPLVVRGEIVRRSPKELDSVSLEGEVDSFQSLTQSLGLTAAELRKVERAARYWIAERATGGAMSKTAFCKKSGEHLPRVSEATGLYPVEWFAQNGLSEFLDVAADEYRNSAL